MATSTKTNVRRTLEARLKELDRDQARIEEERQALQRSLELVGAAATSSTRQTRKSTNGRRKSTNGRRKSSTQAKSRRTTKRAKRLPKAERQQALYEFAKKNPEASNADIAKALGINPNYASTLVSTDKKITRKDGKLTVKS